MDMLPVDYATCECLTLGTDEIRVLAGRAETGGALFAIRMRMPPGGGPPLMHRHVPSEVYYVIDGEFTFYVGLDPVRRVIGRAGDTVPLAGNIPHTVRNESAADAVALVVHAPGGPFEDFVRAAAALADSGAPRMEDVLAVAEQHGIEMLGPIPAVSA